MQPAQPTSPYTCFVGIDIGAAKVAMSVRGVDGTATPAMTFAQTADDHVRLIATLCATGIPPSSTLVVMEASGVYTQALATTLAKASYVVSIINPRQAHHFARALLKRRKTDAVDAETLAELGARLQPRPWQLPPPMAPPLQQRLALRDTLVQMRTQARNQHHALLRNPTVTEVVQERLESLLVTLTKEVAALERELVDLTKQDDAWASSIRRLQTIPGIGLITACRIISITANFSRCESPKQASSYAGLVLFERSSGQSIRDQQTGRIGASGTLRRALYQATFNATRFNPPIKVFYERLRAAGKPVKVARCAAARKLLVIAWTLVTKKQDFDPEHYKRASQGDARDTLEAPEE